MNIRQHIAVETLAAGGPGSGRRPEDVLKEKGWKADGYHFKYGKTFVHDSHPREYISLRPNGESWQHNNGGEAIKRGNGGDKLESHLSGLQK